MLNDTPVPSISEFLPTLQTFKGKTVDARIERKTKVDTIVSLAVSDAGKIGIQMLSPYELSRQNFRL